jgi:hypothetical protein
MVSIRSTYHNIAANMHQDSHAKDFAQLQKGLNQYASFLQVLMPGPYTKGAAITATYGEMNPLVGMWLRYLTITQITQIVAGKAPATNTSIRLQQPLLLVTPGCSTVYLAARHRLLAHQATEFAIGSSMKEPALLGCLPCAS